MKFYFFCLVFFCFWSLPAISRAADSVIIQKVIDGETVELSDGRRVRLIGVRTSRVQPVLTERFQMPLEKILNLPLGQLSLNAVKYIENHAMGKNVILSFDPAYEKSKHQDNQGRVLAYVWYQAHFKAGEDSDDAGRFTGIQTQEKLLNEELIRMGNALADTTTSFLQQPFFLSAEQSAARAQNGFWRSAAELYQGLLFQAKATQYGATAGFVDKEAQKISLESSWKIFTELISLNPKNFRPYYERSWLGADSVHNKMTEANLSDVDKAIELSPFDPKGYMQKAYLLWLMGKYSEANQSYEKMRQTAEKMGIPGYVTEISEEKIRSEMQKEMAKDSEEYLFALQGWRGTLNEDHFLIFMSWYQSLSKTETEKLKEIYKQISAQGRFPLFLKKYEAVLSSSNARNLLYATQWAIQGHEVPEKVIPWMETMGEIPADLLPSRPEKKIPRDRKGQSG